MTVKQFIRIRLKLGLTQGELAKDLGVSRKTINHIENGLADIGKRTELAMKMLRDI